MAAGHELRVPVAGRGPRPEVRLVLAAVRELLPRFPPAREVPLDHLAVGARPHELRAESAHDAHQSSVELARRQLARARADREVIERHFARWRDTQKKLAERRHE